MDHSGATIHASLVVLVGTGVLVKLNNQVKSRDQRGQRTLPCVMGMHPTYCRRPCIWSKHTHKRKRKVRRLVSV